MAFPAELLDRSCSHVGWERLAVPAVLVLDLREALALDRLREDDRRRLGISVLCRRKCTVDRRKVMAVDHDRTRSESLHSPRIRLQIPLELGRAALAEAVDVGHHYQVRQLVIGRLVDCLPDRTLGQLAVAAEHPDPERRVFEVLTRKSDAHAVRQPLTQRAGRHVHPWQHRRRMPFEPLAEPPVPGHELLVAHHPDGFVERVEQR